MKKLHLALLAALLSVTACGQSNEKKLKSLPDISAYETVVIGTPVWGYTLANPVFAFMRQADLSGKRVYGFWTFYDHDEKCDADFKAETRGGEYVKGLPLPRSLTGNRNEYEKAIRAFAGLVTGTDSRL